MTSSLFRPEALEFQKQYREFGQVGRLQSSSAKMLAWLLTIAVGALIAFICVAGYTRKETVGGYLAPALGTSSIFVPEQGTITSVHVAQDQRVAKGDLLLTVDKTQITADGTDVNAAILKSLSLQKTLLTNQINEEQRTTRTERDRLSAAITSGEAELAQLSAQMKIQQEQIDLAQQLVVTAEKMHASGYMAAPELYSRRENLLQARQGLSALKQRYVARETELAETRSALEQLPGQSARRLQPLQSELAQLDQRTAETGARQSFSIRAPIDGRIANVQSKVGQVADPRKPQLDILPLESPLQAVLFVPTRAIGFVRPGQKVRLLYEAFPFQRFGTYSGRVVTVSKTILSETDLNSPVQLREPAYKVVAALDRPDIDANGQKIPLQAGTLLRADILLERRELVRWLLDPILNVRM
jgi:membrane fusion protein